MRSGRYQQQYEKHLLLTCWSYSEGAFPDSNWPWLWNAQESHSNLSFSKLWSVPTNWVKQKARVHCVQQQRAPVQNVLIVKVTSPEAAAVEYRISQNWISDVSSMTINDGWCWICELHIKLIYHDNMDVTVSAASLSHFSQGTCGRSPLLGLVKGQVKETARLVWKRGNYLHLWYVVCRPVLKLQKLWDMNNQQQWWMNFFASWPETGCSVLW